MREVFLAREEDAFVRWSCLNAMASLSLQDEGLQATVIGDAALALGGAPGWEIEEAARSVLRDYCALGQTEEVLQAIGADALRTWLARGARNEAFCSARRDPLAFYDPKAIAARHAAGGCGPNVAARAPGWSQARNGEGLPFVRRDPKVGRNDPCPCGSGREHRSVASADRRAVLRSGPSTTVGEGQLLGQDRRPRASAGTGSGTSRSEPRERGGR